ncbi:hypothetical protein B1813_09180 [Saccharomonospora piscinae]|uniref:PPE domain-containing protein n=2 Tax=Saccharomonospora piscinae TaxID=687388 RepID=A0A1V9A5F8_SACPI|nr:hypothetical protein B1813_09180 [Saccharomonospora piscinae]
MSGMQGDQIYQNFRNAPGTGGMESVADVLVELRRSYQERAQAIKQIQERMQAGWTGDAGAAASAGAGPLTPALHESAENMERTFGSVTSQAAAWNQAANSVEPVPSAPQEPSVWDDITSFGGASDTFEENLARHNAVAQRNVDVMSRYEAATSANQDFPRSYTTLPSSGAAITVASAAPGAVSTEMSAAPDVRSGTSGVTGTPTTSGAAPVNGSAGFTPRPGPSSGGGISPTTPGVPGGGGGGTSPPSTTPGPGLAGTTPVRPGQDPARPGPGRTANPRTPTGRGGSLSDRAGSRLYGGKPAAGSAPTGGQGGTGARVGDGAAKGGPLGAGRGTGTGAVGGAALGDAAARGAAGGAGGRGAGAPMGAGAGRGQGDEDKEHQRAAYLQENDPDEAFIGDLGKTAPPVIGE